MGAPNLVLAHLGEDTCATANAAGLAGHITPEQCQLLQDTGPSWCSCGPLQHDDNDFGTREQNGQQPIQLPSEVTSRNPLDSSRQDECNAHSCTLVHNWAQVAAFVQHANDGELLCLCGRLYKHDLCATDETTILLDQNKDVSLECAEGQICSVSCPHPAAFVRAGSLTLVGNGRNFMLSGGTQASRIWVGADGRFSASGIIVKE